MSRMAALEKSLFSLLTRIIPSCFMSPPCFPIPKRSNNSRERGISAMIWCFWCFKKVKFFCSQTFNSHDYQKKKKLGDDPFISSSISSRMVHVIFVIKKLTPEQHLKDPNKTYYSLTVIRKDGVPPFAPLIESPSVFERGDEFRNLLFKKLLNAERAIYEVDIIAQKMLKTRSLLLEGLASN